MNAKRISVNLIGQLVSFACSLGISFVLTPYIVASLGQETYGFVGLANNFTNYITLFTVALNGMLSRYVTVEYSKKDYEKASGYFATALIAQSILAVVLVVPMLFLANHVEHVVNISIDIIPDVKLLWSLLFLSFLIGLPASCFGTATFAKNRLDIAACIRIVGNLLRAGILVVAFMFYTPHVWYIGIATIASNILGICCNFYYKLKHMPEVKISRQYFDIKYIKSLLVVGVWNSLNKLQQILYTGLDLLLTNLFINGAEMGLLSIAKTVPTQISTLIGTVSGTFEPSMTIAYGKGNMGDFLHETKFAMKLSGFLCSVPIMGFVCFGLNFYTLWMPSLSDEELIKIQFLAILTLLPQVFSVYIYPLYTVNTITTKLKIPVLLSVGIGIANILIVFILLKTTSLGVYAVAGVSSILWILRIFLFVPIYAAWCLHVDWKIFYPSLFRGVCNVGILGALFTVIAFCFHVHSWMQLVVICGFSGLIGYITAFFVMFDRVDKKRAIVAIRKRFVRKRQL